MEQNAGRIYYSHNIVNLCIDTYTAKMQCGKLWCQYREVPVTFTSLIEALRWMEDLYDTLRYPQAAARTRSFCGGGSGGMISLEADTDEAGAASAEEYDHGRAGILAGDGRGDLSVRRRKGNYGWRYGSLGKGNQSPGRGGDFSHQSTIQAEFQLAGRGGMGGSGKAAVLQQRPGSDSADRRCTGRNGRHIAGKLRIGGYWGAAWG